MICFVGNVIPSANLPAETSVCGSLGHRIAAACASEVDVEPGRVQICALFQGTEVGQLIYSFLLMC